MSAMNMRRAMDSIKYLGSHNATNDAIQRLKYWRESPTLSDGIRVGNELATSDQEWDKFEGFLLIDSALNKANIELLLLKRLNYISLWTTVRAMAGDNDDKKALKDAKV